MEPLASAVSILALLQVLGFSVGAEAYLSSVVSAALIVKGPLTGWFSKQTIPSLITILVILMGGSASLAWLTFNTAIGSSITMIVIGISITVGVYVLTHLRMMESQKVEGLSSPK